MEISFHPLPTQLTRSAAAIEPLLQLQSSAPDEADMAGEDEDGSNSSCQSSLMRRALAAAPSAEELAEPDLPILTAHQLADPGERQQLFASLAAQAHEERRQAQAQRDAGRSDGWSQHDAGSASATPPPPPPRRKRFLVSKKLLPTLLGNQPLPPTVQPAAISTGAAALQLPLPVSPDEAPPSDADPALSAFASSLAPAPALSESSSLAAISSFAASLPSLPLGSLVTSDAARLKLRTSQSAVAPKPVYPTPTAAERAFLDAARVGDWSAMLRAMQPPRPHELQNSYAPPAPLPPVRLGIADPRTGATALHLLSALGAEDCVERLLHWRPLNTIPDLPLLMPDVNARASNLATPLHWAAGNGHAGTVAALLRAGADPRARSVTWNHTVFGRGSGQTPAHWAAESGHLDCVRLLHAAAPASAAMLDERLASPRDVAQKAAQPGVAAFLKEAAAEEYVCVEINLRWQGEKLVQRPQQPQPPQ